MKQFRITILILLVGISYFGFSQTNNNTCANATPFCTGQTMTFPSTTGVPNSQPGPSYGCLGSQPNPAWFFMQISTGGSLSIAMGAQSDIDFICWGPFPNLTGACGNLTAANTIDCSYSAAATETCDIANALPGEFYIMLITNFSNQAQTITFNQNNTGTTGAGSTNCGFVCLLNVQNSGLVCVGGSPTISIAPPPATSTAVSTFTWVGPNGYTSNSATNILTNLMASGMYTLYGTASSTLNGVPQTGTCQAITAVSVVAYPTFTPVSNNYTICQGGTFVGCAQTSLSPSQFTALWSSAAPGLIFNPTPTFANPPTFCTTVLPALLAPNVSQALNVYTLTLKPNLMQSCSVSHTLGITINNPLTPTITPPAPVCDITAPVQLIANPPGGTWGGNPNISLGGLFNPATATTVNQYFSYSVSVGSCVVSSSDSIAVSKFYSAALTTSSLNLCVQDQPFNLMNIAQNVTTGNWSAVAPNQSIVNGNFLNPSGLPTGNYNLIYNTTSLPNPTVCPSSTQIAVQIYNPPTPTIVPMLPLCSKIGTFQLTALPLNPTGVWSGNLAVSPSGIGMTTSSAILANNTVVYTAGQGTCVVSSIGSFNVSQFNPATITAVIPDLCVTSNPINLMSIVSNTNGSWMISNGANSINSNTFTPGNAPANAAPTIYNLTYSTQSTPPLASCTDSKTLAISVLNPPIPNITKVGPFCSVDNPVQLTVSPAVGHWVQSSYVSSSGLFSPAIGSLGNNIVQYVIGTSTCNVSQTENISVEAFVSAALTSKVPDQCTTGLPVSLAPIVVNNTGYWTGTGIVGSNFDPSLNGSGNFILTYNTSSFPSGLCPDKSLASVEVFSLATPAISKIGPFCNNALPVQLNVSPVGGLFGGPTVGAVTSGGVFNPALALVGKNLVSYSISSGPCRANALVEVEVEKFVSASFGKDVISAYCVNTLPFNLNSLVQNPGGNWSGGPGVIGSMFDPGKANIGSNNVIVYETHSPSPLLCPDRSTIAINIKTIPAVKVESSVKSGCAPLEVTLNSFLTEQGRGEWYLEDGSASIAGLNANPVFTKPGTYNVVFSYTDKEAAGCSTQVVLKDPIRVLESPQANFSIYPEEISISDPQANIYNLSTTLGNNKYQWTVEGLGQVYEINPVLNFPLPGRYKVTLVATTVDGCRDEISKTVEVKNDFGVYIPNSFTPNFDDLNDQFRPVFTPYGLDVKTYSMEIFDRWGALLFSTKDYTAGWNGTVQNKGDEALKEDTYVYKIRYKDLNGQLYSKIGEITLIK